MHWIRPDIISAFLKSTSCHVTASVKARLWKLLGFYFDEKRDHITCRECLCQTNAISAFLREKLHGALGTQIDKNLRNAPVLLLPLPTSFIRLFASHSMHTLKKKHHANYIRSLLLLIWSPLMPMPQRKTFCKVGRREVVVEKKIWDFLHQNWLKMVWGCTHTAASCGQSGHKRTAEEIKGNKYNNDKWGESMKESIEKQHFQSRQKRKKKYQNIADSVGLLLPLSYLVSIAT